jgi:outer membrane protein
MQNKLTLALIIVLILAVSGLYYLQFSKSAPSKKEAKVTKQSLSISESSLRLAYIDLDTIKDKYDYFRLKNSELEREKQRIENEIEAGVQKLEADRNNFLKKGQSISQQEAEQFQMEFQTRYQALGEKREKLLNQHLSNQAKAMDDIQSRINAYLKDYNKTAGYHFIFSTGEGNLTLYYKDESYNITEEVLEGLNESYQKEKKK